VTGWPFNLAQSGDADDEEDIAKTHHVDQGVYDFVNGNIPPTNEIGRRATPPKSAEVKNWPFPQYAQDVDVAKNRYINEGVYDFVNDNVPPVNEVKRGYQAPKSAEVKNWPYPQYAQAEDIAANKYISRNVHKMASQYVPAANEWERSAKPPTKASVKGWPYPQYAQETSSSGDIAANKYINRQVHGMASKYVPAYNEWDRRAKAPTRSEVKGWPYPQYSQESSEEWPYPDKTESGKEIQHTFNDAHFHSPRHVWNRSEEAPKGALVKGWPATSPPEDKALLQGDDKKPAAAPPAGVSGASNETEKVHILEPTAYQGAANSNLPGPRTTFYVEKGGYETRLI
jgi:hypothetical protein